MQKVFIVQRVEPLTGKKGFAPAQELRAFATAERASAKVKEIYDSLIGWCPASMHYKIKLDQHAQSGLYKSVASEDGTKWSVVEVEILN